MEEITSGTLLTEEQLKHNFRVFAGPGAGKTHFLTENIKNIIIELGLIFLMLMKIYMKNF